MVRARYLEHHGTATWTRHFTLSVSLCWPCVRQWEPKHFSYNFDAGRGRVSTSVFAGARTNIAFNCLDRHVEAGRGGQPCFLWEVLARSCTGSPLVFCVIKHCTGCVCPGDLPTACLGR